MRVLLLLALLLVAALAWLLLQPPGGGGELEPSTRPMAVRSAGPRPPSALPGTPLIAPLIEAPAERYADPVTTEADRALAPLVARAGGQYDVGLGRAARELAAFYAAEGRLAPGAVLAFFLDSAGVAAWGVRQGVVATTDRSDRALVEAVAEHLGSEPGPWQVGVGEAVRLGDGPGRVIAVLLAHPTHRLDPVDRSAPTGTLEVAGDLLPGHRRPELVVLSPDQRFIDVPVQVTGQRFRAAWPAEQSGQWVAELLADGPHGPTPLNQLTFFVDEALPEVHEGTWPMADPEGTDPGDHAFALVQRDRQRFGLPPFQRDAALDAVARAHCADMRSTGFVGHISPTTGGPGERLVAAGYRAAASGENVALNKSLADAQDGLLRSLGHRRNLLSTDFTHLGVAALAGGEHWYVTQLFATPRPRLDDLDAARGELLGRLADARSAAGVPGLRRLPALDRLAQAEAERAEPTPRHLLAAAGEADFTGRLSAWVGRLGLLSQFEPEGGLLDSEFRRVGLGVRQDAEGVIRVVVLLAE